MMDVPTLEPYPYAPPQEKTEDSKIGWLGGGWARKTSEDLAAVGWTTWEIGISVSVRSDKAVVHVERFETFDIF